MASKVAKPAQIQPKSQFLFHKNLPPHDFSIMTLDPTVVANIKFTGVYGFIYFFPFSGSEKGRFNETFLLVGSFKTNTISVNARNAATGQLKRQYQQLIGH